VLDILVQGRRNAAAAKRFFKQLLQILRCKPRRLITDGLRSHSVAHRTILPEVRDQTSRDLTDIFAGLMISQDMQNFSDGTLCERWLENPYMQVFYGEHSFQRALVRLVVADALGALLQESLSVR